MISFLESLNAGKGSFVENGQFFALFLLALLFLWLVKAHDKKELLWFAFVTTILLLFPLTAGVLTKYQTAFYAYEHVWIALPLTILLAYGLVEAVSGMLVQTTKTAKEIPLTPSGKKARFYEMSIIIALAGLLFFGGTVVPAEAVTPRTNRTDGLPEEIGEALDLLEIPEGEQVLLAAPDDIIRWSRIYNGNILLPYGRDMVETGLTAYVYDKYTSDLTGLHDWVQGALTAPPTVEEAYRQEEAYVEQCVAAGVDYLMFTVERANNELLEHALENSKVYSICAETEAYVIYSR